MKTYPFTYGRAVGPVPASVATAFTEGESGPLTYALGVVTGLPGYGAVPVVVSAGTDGVAVTGFDGYTLATYYPLPFITTPGSKVYYAGLGLLRALPNALTFSALTALGFDFDSYVLPGPVVAGTPSVNTLGGVKPFTAADFESYAGASRAPNGNVPGLASVPAGVPGSYATATVVFDAVGVEVYFFNADLSAAGLYYLHFSDSPDNVAYALGAVLVGTLPAGLTPAYLSRLGFTPSPA